MNKLEKGPGVPPKETPDTDQEEEKDYHTGEEAIEECLTSKQIGFKRISVETVHNILRQAPEGETFTVPDDRYKITYEDYAKDVDRKDLKFVVGE